VLLRVTSHERSERGCADLLSEPQASRSDLSFGTAASVQANSETTSRRKPRVLATQVQIAVLRSHVAESQFCQNSLVHVQTYAGCYSALAILRLIAADRSLHVRRCCFRTSNFKTMIRCCQPLALIPLVLLSSLPICVACLLLLLCCAAHKNSTFVSFRALLRLRQRKQPAEC
jgi:hypothetical protein